MKFAAMAEVQSRLDEYVQASGDEPIVLTRHGKPVAVLYGMTDEDDLERLKMACSPQLQEILRAANKRIDETGGIPHDQFWAAMEKKYPAELGNKKKKAVKRRK